ncbi:MAG TPA: arginine repressor [Clostridiales bacterium]|nr:arginine repressor [Clostridiales bacterium]
MKISRQGKIIELIHRYNVETQEELSALLKKAGYKVTQATISRDIRDLRLTKVTENGISKYKVLNQANNDLTQKYIETLRNGFIFMDIAQNIIVIKTVSGMAMAVAASIDSMDIPNIVGCIAGDDTIMCVVRSEEETPSVMDDLNKLINSNIDN